MQRNLSKLPQSLGLGISSSEQFWREAERRLRRRFVWARGLEAVRVPLLVVSAMAVPMGFALRGGGVPGWQVGSLAFGAGLFCVFWVFLQSRGVALWCDGLFPRMDERLGLHAQLCAANQGVGGWPEPVAEVDRLWRWDALRALSGVMAWLLACAILVLFPERHSVVRAVPANRPPVVTEAEQLLSALEANEALEKEALKEFREELERMKARDAKDWFSQGGMEAASQLNRELEQGGRQLAAQLERMQDALQDFGASGGTEGSVAAGERLSAALRALAGTKPGLDKGLEQMLRQVAASGTKSISAQEFKEMQERLSEALRKLGECGLCKSSGTGRSDAEGGRGSGTGPSEDAASDTPLSFSSERTRLDAGLLEALPSAAADGAGAVAGDVFREIRKAPQAEVAGAAVGPAGGVNLSTNGGGVAVWRSRPVPPEEAQRLRRYFSGKREGQ